MKQTVTLLLLCLTLLAAVSCSEQKKEKIEWYPVMYKGPSDNAFSNYLYKYVKPTGEELLIENLKEASFFRDGMSRISFKGQKGYGYVNDKGELVIPTLYLSASLFSEGLAWAHKLDANYNSPVDVINTKGEVVFSKAVRAVRKYQEGLCAFYDGGEWGFVDSKGNVIVEPKYRDVSNFSKGLAAVLVESSWGYIDTNGNFVIEPQFRSAAEFDENNQAVVGTEKGDAVITRKNEFVISPGKYRFISSDGDLYRASTHEETVWCDKSGKEISSRIENRKASYSMFNGSNKAWVGDHFINRKGSPIEEIPASLMDNIDDVDVFRNDIAIFKGKNGLYGFMDIDGNLLMKPQYQQFGPGLPVCGSGVNREETRF